MRAGTFHTVYHSMCHAAPSKAIVAICAALSLTVACGDGVRGLLVRSKLITITLTKASRQIVTRIGVPIYRTSKESLWNGLKMEVWCHTVERVEK